MRTHRFQITLLLAAAAVTMILPVPRTGAAPIKPGDAFVPIDGSSLEGSLPDLKGKVVLVDFWASWCAPCKASFPALNELHQRYRDKGLVIVAISVDEKASDMQSFLKKVPAQFAVLRDAKQKLIAATSVETMPTSFILDRAGKVRFVHNGFKGSETVKKYREELDSLLNTSAK